MLVLVWIALAVGLLAPVGGATAAARSAWRGWRALRRTTAILGAGLDRVATSGAATAEHAALALDRASALGEAATRLQRSLDELAVLRRAARRTNAGLSSIRRALPRP